MLYHMLQPDGTFKLTDDIKVWGEWFENYNTRRIDQSHIGRYWVSTVFLGIDHGFDGGSPLMFETMVFD